MANFISEGWDDVTDNAVDAVEDLFGKDRTVYGGSDIGEDVFTALGINKGFRFPSVEDANKIINSFKDRRDSIERRKQDIQRALDLLVSVPFSRDPASLKYIRQAKDSLSRLDELNDSALKYTTNYIDKLESAKRIKRNSEEDISEGFDKAVGSS